MLFHVNVFHVLMGFRGEGKKRIKALFWFFKEVRGLFGEMNFYTIRVLEIVSSSNGYTVVRIIMINSELMITICGGRCWAGRMLANMMHRKRS